MRRDLVEIFQDLESGETPIYHVAPTTHTEVVLPKYEKPAAGPVRSVSVDEYLATRRSRAG
jgi:hypothetical protein